MKLECSHFRSTLERALAGQGSQLASLSWHEHLLGCGDCRALLEAEEALELLLATLPEPRLPLRLAQRVIVRLRAARTAEAASAGLDDLLALDRELPSAPGGLAERVLAGLAAERAEAAEVALDRVLARAAKVDVPLGLSGRVLGRLAPQRARPALVGSRRLAGAWAWALAAGLVIALGVWSLWPRHAPEGTPGLVEREPRRAVSGELPPDENLLAALDVLEQWDLLMQDDVDVLLSTIAPADESLLEFREGEDAAAPAEETPGEAEKKPAEKKG